MVNPPKDEHIKSFKKIRKFAMQCIKNISIERLDLISLQLIQALRYEDIQEDYRMVDSPLRDYLLQVAETNELLAHSLHWHLELERNNDTNQPKMLNFYGEMWDELMGSLEQNNNVVY